jgi:HD-GYP domain-containing protein (c-di-GMP phosphodiesterase class II)
MKTVVQNQFRPGGRMTWCKGPEPAAPQPVVSPARDTAKPEEPMEEFRQAARILAQSKRAVTGLFHEARLGKTIELDGVLPLVADISASIARNSSALISLARIKTKDDYTYMHSVAVCALMVNLGRQLGFDDDAARELGLAGLLHDVGKMMMPQSVLNKQGRLTDDEYAVARLHPEQGHAFLLHGTDIPAAALDVCLHHHERFDGAGYPHGLAGQAISLPARMGAVCDVYDAVTSNRPYKKAWDAADTLAQMFSWRGHFDDQVLSAFIRSIGIYPVGSLVRLRSERLALVVAQNAADLTRPQLRAFHSIARRCAIPHEDIDLRVRGDERLLSRELPEDWGFTDWEALWPKLIG